MFLFLNDCFLNYLGINLYASYTTKEVNVEVLFKVSLGLLGDLTSLLAGSEGNKP